MLIRGAKPAPIVWAGRTFVDWSLGRSCLPWKITMIECQTGQLRALITPRINDALDCLLLFPEIFTNEAASYAISEISEQVMTLIGGARVKQSNKGFDIVAGNQRIEVKARFVGKWGEDAVHFNLWATFEVGPHRLLSVIEGRDQ